MKIRCYFLSVVCAGLLFSCSDDDNIPEIHVFKPDATLSFATSVDGERSGLRSASYDDSEDANIHQLQMIIFTGHGDDATFQTDTFIEYETPVKAPLIKDKLVQSGSISLLVLANHTKYTIPSGTKLSDFLEGTISLDQEGGNNGYVMSSKVGEYNVVAGKHNTIALPDTEEADHLPANSMSSTPVELVRIVSKVNLVGLTLSTAKLPDGSTPKSFQVNSIFVSNVKSVSRIASTGYWGAVETTLDTEDIRWWFGAFYDKSYNDIYSIVSGSEKELLLVNVADDQTLKNNLNLTVNNPVYPTSTDVKVIGKSFLVYENMNRSNGADGIKNEVPLGEQTVLVVCGDYTRTLSDGTDVTETNRFYTIPVNNKDFGAGTPSGVDSHQYIKRNVKYNISLKIISSGSSTPYGKDAYAHVSAQVEVAPWHVVNMGGDAD